MEFANKIWGVFDANSKRDYRARISHDCVAYVRLELVQILMGHGEADAILAKFREHVCQGQGSKTLEFVDIDEEVSAFGRWCVGSTERCKPDGRDEQPAEERRAI